MREIGAVVFQGEVLGGRGGGGGGVEIEEALSFPRHLGYGWVLRVLAIIVESRALVVDTAGLLPS